MLVRPFFQELQPLFLFLTFTKELELGLTCWWLFLKVRLGDRRCIYSMLPMMLPMLTWQKMRIELLLRVWKFKFSAYKAI